MDSVEASFLRRRANDHLLHLNMARRFIEQVTGASVPDDILEFQERLRNGVYLARLARTLAQDDGFLIFDEDQGIYERQGFHYKHINNIQTFLKYLKRISLPTVSDKVLGILAKFSSCCVTDFPSGNTGYI